MTISFQAEHFGTFLLLTHPCAEGGVAQLHLHHTAEDVWQGANTLARHPQWCDYLSASRLWYRSGTDRSI